MSEYFLKPHEHSGKNIKVELNLFKKKQQVQI